MSRKINNSGGTKKQEIQAKKLKITENEKYIL